MPDAEVEKPEVTSRATPTAWLKAETLAAQGRADQLLLSLLDEHKADEAKAQKLLASTARMYQILLGGSGLLIVVLIGAVLALAGRVFEATVNKDGVTVSTGHSTQETP